MKESAQRGVEAIRPAEEVLTRQRLPYFVGISKQTVGASGLSMHLVVIPRAPVPRRTATSTTRPASTSSKARCGRAGATRSSTRS
jgi:uncharacterized RmlC-like cupin family protein